jgi:hypothetical protein
MTGALMDSSIGQTRALDCVSGAINCAMIMLHIYRVPFGYNLAAVDHFLDLLAGLTATLTGREGQSATV